MTLAEADKRLEELEANPQRSRICSFINDLSASKFITESQADAFADTLAADRSNAVPVLNSIKDAVVQTCVNHLANKFHPEGK
jgi:hypothetical protein